jgi:hypothetical protein
MKLILFLLMAVFLSSCSGKKVKGDDFKVEVKLSKAASSKLAGLNETIKVIAFFDGDGEKIKGQDSAPFRDVFLGKKEVEIQEGEKANFTNIWFSQSDYSRLYSPKYYVTLNVVSGRRAHKNNLLACDVPIETIDHFANRVTAVNCNLIEEQ